MTKLYQKFIKKTGDSWDPPLLVGRGYGAENVRKYVKPMNDYLARVANIRRIEKDIVDDDTFMLTFIFDNDAEAERFYRARVDRSIPEVGAFYDFLQSWYATKPYDKPRVEYSMQTSQGLVKLPNPSEE